MEHPNDSASPELTPEFKEMVRDFMTKWFALINATYRPGFDNMPPGENIMESIYAQAEYIDEALGGIKENELKGRFTYGEQRWFEAVALKAGIPIPDPKPRRWIIGG